MIADSGAGFMQPRKLCGLRNTQKRCEYLRKRRLLMLGALIPAMGRILLSPKPINITNLCALIYGALNEENLGVCCKLELLIDSTVGSATLNAPQIRSNRLRLLFPRTFQQSPPV
ncbi:hypothetical protein RRG08_002196 [Elysia crispata]|uniref:Uncharacterized protein n=1 Tax=Elysia crispata TaxID=231223 RepID=A0AAE0ZAN6_9GAST|nr:hypothetical protein RRG08_002196 [Elysia crispata]